MTRGIACDPATRSNSARRRGWHRGMSGGASAGAAGPGGQNVNKTATRAELRVALSGLGGIHPEALDRIRTNAGHYLIESSDEIRIVSQEHRSQPQNREECLARLRILVESCEFPPKVRRKTKPTRASKERRLKEKREHSEKKRNRKRPNKE